jgi:hypothetical protein
VAIKRREREREKEGNMKIGLDTWLADNNYLFFPVFLTGRLVFPRESHFVIPVKAGMQILFPGNSRDPGN